MSRRLELIYDDDEEMIVDLDNPRSLVDAMHFKAAHIKAKANPNLFDAVAEQILKGIQTTSNQNQEVCKLYEEGRCFATRDAELCSCNGAYAKCELPKMCK